MKLSKHIAIILLSLIFVSGCNSAKKILMGDGKNNTDEFLIKSKNPLILPPEFDNLPKPQKKINEDEVQNKDIDFSGVLEESKNKKKKTQEKNNSLEESISKILNRN